MHTMAFTDFCILKYPASSSYVTSVSATAVAGAQAANIGPVPHRGALSAPCQTTLLNCTRGPFPITEVLTDSVCCALSVMCLRGRVRVFACACVHVPPQVRANGVHVYV